MHKRWIVTIAVLLLVSLIAVPGLAAQGRQPETAGGTALPAAPGPLAPLRPLAAGGLLYKTSLDTYDPGFEAYDPVPNGWTTLIPFETGAQMAVSGAGQLYAYNYYNATIDLYDPVNDAWTPVLASPPGAAGQYGNLEVTNAGEFLYTEPWGTTLWYTVGGAWFTMALPFPCDAMGDYDPTTGQYVIGEAWTTNAHWIDLNTWAITDYYSPVGNGEYARFSVVMGNRYYFEAGGSNIHYFDLANPAAPPVDTGVNLSWYSSAAADRANGIIYVASLDGTQLWAYDPATNTATPLAGGSYGWHSSLAFTGAGGPPPNTLTCGVILAQPALDPYGRILVRWKVEVLDQNSANVPLVAVTADLTTPQYPLVTKVRWSHLDGFANFPYGSQYSGFWAIDVSNMVLTGYTFVDGPNCSASGYW